jgi:hypothetical protein
MVRVAGYWVSDGKEQGCCDCKCVECAMCAGIMNCICELFTLTTVK